MEHSSVMPAGPVVGRRGGRGGIPVVGYPRVPGVPPVSVVRWPADAATVRIPVHRTHAHDFLVLLYVESGHGVLRIDDHDWPVGTGDAFVVAPGAVVAAGQAAAAAWGRAWLVLFPADAVDPDGPGPLTSWRAHPLLFPFARGRASGGQPLQVPPAARGEWTRNLAALDDELRAGRDGYADAVRALLTLLLVRLARLGPRAADELRMRNEPLLASVFDVIDARFHEPISLRDVAAAVGLTPGHLTTVVSRRTGRSVQQWIIDRRMSAARRLLSGTDLTVRAVAGRVGYRDAGYFGRQFRRIHGLAPAQWRRGGRWPG